MAWYRKNQAKLLRGYRSKYVAIVDGVVIDHDPDFHALATRMFGRFGNRNMYMPRVQAEEPTVQIRSPRLLRR